MALPCLALFCSLLALLGQLRNSRIAALTFAILVYSAGFRFTSDYVGQHTVLTFISAPSPVFVSDEQHTVLTRDTAPKGDNKATACAISKHNLISYLASREAMTGVLGLWLLD